MRGTLLGAQGGLIAAAYVVGPAIGGGLTHFYGAQTAYCSVAALIGLCGAAFATLPETRGKAASSSTRGDLAVEMGGGYDMMSLL